MESGGSELGDRVFRVLLSGAGEPHRIVGVQRRASAITLTVFSVFSVLYLGEKFRWNYATGFGCIVLGAFFVFHKW